MSPPRWRYDERRHFVSPQYGVTFERVGDAQDLVLVAHDQRARLCAQPFEVERAAHLRPDGCDRSGEREGVRLVVVQGLVGLLAVDDQLGQTQRAWRPIDSISGFS